MMMRGSLRKFALTAHVTCSVAWMGSVGAFLAIAIVGLHSADAQLVRAAYLSMNLIGWAVIVPLSIASPVTGLVMSLGTSWGLFRHYWIVIKLVITLLATGLLLLHMHPVGHMARFVETTMLQHGELAGVRVQLVADAAAALVALLVTTTLSVYKPAGLTPYGWRKFHQMADARTFAGG